MHSLSNITSESLKSVRRTILFIDTQVRSMELSKPIRKRLDKYYGELKETEERLVEYLNKTGGRMISVYGEENPNANNKPV